MKVLTPMYQPSKERKLITDLDLLCTRINKTQDHILNTTNLENILTAIYLCATNKNDMFGMYINSTTNKENTTKENSSKSKNRPDFHYTYENEIHLIGENKQTSTVNEVPDMINTIISESKEYIEDFHEQMASSVYMEGVTFNAIKFLGKTVKEALMIMKYSVARISDSRNKMSKNPNKVIKGLVDDFETYGLCIIGYIHKKEANPELFTIENIISTNPCHIMIWTEDTENHSYFIPTKYASSFNDTNVCVTGASNVRPIDPSEVDKLVNKAIETLLSLTSNAHEVVNDEVKTVLKGEVKDYNYNPFKTTINTSSDEYINKVLLITADGALVNGQHSTNAHRLIYEMSKEELFKYIVDNNLRKPEEINIDKIFSITQDLKFKVSLTPYSSEEVATKQSATSNTSNAVDGVYKVFAPYSNEFRNIIEKTNRCYEELNNSNILLGIKGNVNTDTIPEDKTSLKITETEMFFTSPETTVNELDPSDRQLNQSLGLPNEQFDALFALVRGTKSGPTKKNWTEALKTLTFSPLAGGQLEKARKLLDIEFDRNDWENWYWGLSEKSRKSEKGIKLQTIIEYAEKEAISHFISDMAEYNPQTVASTFDDIIKVQDFYNSIVGISKSISFRSFSKMILKLVYIKYGVTFKEGGCSDYDKLELIMNDFKNKFNSSLKLSATAWDGKSGKETSKWIHFLTQLDCTVSTPIAY